MQKTKLGITAGALGAATFFAGLFGGYLVAVVLAGYVLLFEENAWLRRCVVKAIVLMFFFSFLTVLVNLLPDAISFISNLVSIFGGSFKVSIVGKIVACITSGISIIQKVLMLGLGIKATRQETIVIPFFDSLVSEYMS